MKTEDVITEALETYDVIISLLLDEGVASHTHTHTHTHTQPHAKILGATEYEWERYFP